MREELIRAALVFLRDPKLASSTLKDKLEFLKGKGLTQVELDEALNLALVNRSKPNGTWNILLMIGLCVGGYKLYKAYMESQAQCQTSEKQLLHQQQHHQSSIDTIHQQHPTQLLQQPMKSELILSKISELAGEVKQLKTLLLSHERFAAPPKIPEWQLNDSNNDADDDGSDR